MVVEHKIRHQRVEHVSVEAHLHHGDMVVTAIAIKKTIASNRSPVLRCGA